MYLEEAIELKELMDNEVELADSYINIANVYVKKNNFVLALKYITLADTICNRYDYQEARVQLYDTYAMFYEAQHDYKTAYTSLIKYHSLKDSFQQLSKSEIDLTELNTNTVNTLTKTNNSRIHYIIWFLCVLVLMPITIMLFLIRYKR